MCLRLLRAGGARLFGLQLPGVEILFAIFDIKADGSRYRDYGSVLFYKVDNSISLKSFKGP